MDDDQSEIPAYIQAAANVRKCKVYARRNEEDESWSYQLSPPRSSSPFIWTIVYPESDKETGTND